MFMSPALKKGVMNNANKTTNFTDISSRVLKTMKKENWGKTMAAKVNERLVNAKDKDIRFFRIDEFKRNIKRVNKFSSGCGDCNRLKIDIADIVETIAEAVDVPGSKRREYDRLISRLSIHMRKEHGFYPPFYFSYFYSFYGFIAGAFLGYLMFLFIPANSEAMFSIGFASCLVVGYIWGSRKDHKIRLQEKLM